MGRRLASSVLVVILASGVKVARAFELKNVRLFEAMLDAETWAARERLRAREQRRRHHDVANALTAVEGAALILQQELDTLSASDRSALGRVLGSGIESLRRSLTEDEHADGPVSLADAVAAVGRDGTVHEGIDADVSPELVASGSRPLTEEALRQLLRFASGQGPGAPVQVRGHRDDTWVVLRLEGCRLPTRLGQRSFLVDENRRPSGWDDAIGVYLAARLIEDQGGSLWVESRPGTPASYVARFKAVGTEDTPTPS